MATLLIMVKSFALTDTAVSYCQPDREAESEPVVKLEPSMVRSRYIEPPPTTAVHLSVKLLWNTESLISAVLPVIVTSSVKYRTGRGTVLVVAPLCAPLFRKRLSSTTRFVDTI